MSVAEICGGDDSAQKPRGKTSKSWLENFPRAGIYIYIYIYIQYIYIYIYIYTHVHRKKTLRFDSFRFRTFSKIHRFGSFRFGNVFFPVRRGSACAFLTRRGSVRFGSVRLRVRFRPVPELHGSIRFGSAGSVRFLIPSCHWCRQVRDEEPVACTVSKQYARKRASRNHTYSATPSCAIIHAQAHAPVRHPCVF